MSVYRAVTTIETTVYDDEGEPVVRPPGTVVNRIVWDGEAPFDLGEGLALEPEGDP